MSLIKFIAFIHAFNQGIFYDVECLLDGFESNHEIEGPRYDDHESGETQGRTSLMKAIIGLVTKSKTS